MAYILQLETATKNCSVAISKDGTTIAFREFADQGYSHAEKLHLFIEEVLTDSNIHFKDLNAVAVSQGPGSYTGLRIGVSSAKGLCYALEIPLIAVDTLGLLARQMKISEGVIIPMIDARRMECYTAIYGPSYEQIRGVEAEIIEVNSFVAISEKIFLIGDGAAKCQSVLTDPKFNFKPEIVYPSAKEMSPVAYEKYLAQDFSDVAYFEPFYLKDFKITN